MRVGYILCKLKYNFLQGRTLLTFIRQYRYNYCNFCFFKLRLYFFQQPQRSEILWRFYIFSLVYIGQNLEKIFIPFLRQRVELTFITWVQWLLLKTISTVRVGSCRRYFIALLNTIAAYIATWIRKHMYVMEHANSHLKLLYFVTSRYRWHF